MNSSGIDKKRYGRYILIAYVIIFIAACVSLFWKCRYGFPYEESYHISTALRFWRGDKMLLHEWHGTQLSFLLLTPVAGLFDKISGGTEGIVLFCRYAFVIFWILFSLFVFYRLKSVSLTGAVISSVMILLYVPSEEMSLYYNTIGIAFLLSACVIIATARKYERFQYFVSGILFSVAVMSCPFLVFAYLVFTVSIIVCLIRKNLRYTRIWLFTFLGIITSMIVFLGTCLSAAPLQYYLKTVPMMFKDNEHAIDFMEKITGYFMEISLSSYVTLIAIVSSLIVIMFVRYRNTPRAVRTGLAIHFLLVLAIYVCYVIQGVEVANLYMFPPVILAPYCRAMFADDINKVLFRYVWIPGILYSFCIHFTSNLGFMSIASACTVSTAASLVMSVRCASSMISSGSRTVIFKVMAASMTAVFAVLFIMLCERRINFVFADNDMSLETTYVDHGIAKGLTISKQSYDTYEFQRSETMPLREDGSVRRILIMTNEYWLYADIGKEVGAYTSLAWVYEPSNLFAYYELFPDRKPDAVYIDNRYGDISAIFEHLGYTKNETPGGGFILYPTT